MKNGKAEEYEGYDDIDMQWVSADTAGQIMYTREVRTYELLGSIEAEYKLCELIEDAQRLALQAVLDSRPVRFEKSETEKVFHNFACDGDVTNTERMEAKRYSAKLLRLVADRAPTREEARAIEYWTEEHTKLIRANLRLVGSIAQEFAEHCDVPFIDLVQEGNIGLMQMVDKFDQRRGLKFSTYAHWWIKQAIGRYIINSAHVVRLPSHIRDLRSNLRPFQEQFWREYRRFPTNEELAELTDIPLQRIEAALSVTSPVPYSLDTPKETIEDGDIFEMLNLEDRDGVLPEDQYIVSDLNQRLREACFSEESPLNDREKEVLRLRHGFGDEMPHTLQQIADIFDLSRERVRQIEKQAIEKLQYRAGRSGILNDIKISLYAEAQH